MPSFGIYVTWNACVNAFGVLCFMLVAQIVVWSLAQAWEKFSLFSFDMVVMCPHFQVHFDLVVIRDCGFGYSDCFCGLLVSFIIIT